MERQKLRPIKYIDGFNPPPRRKYYIDDFYRQTAAPKPQTELTPSAAPVSSPKPSIQPDILKPAAAPVLTAPTQNVLAAPPETVNGIPKPDLSQAVDVPAQPSILGANFPPIAANEPVKELRKEKSRLRKALKPSLISLAVLIAAGAIWFGSSIIGNIDKVFHGNVFSDAHALISGSTLKESGGRVNILLAGDSADQRGHQGATLTDSIMVLSIDPKTGQGFIMSVPRDLWVDIPSLGYQKINAANDVTSFNQPGLPKGGMGQLQQIVQQDLGIPIDYEALIDYTAFRDAVNAVGGIKIDIQSPDPRGIYDAYTHLKLPNGEVTLNGQEALDLARARGDNAAGDVSYGFPNSDFDRTMHQRQMLVALFKKATTIGVLSNPLKISGLFSALGNNVQTNLSLGDANTLARITNNFNLSHVQSVTYSYTGANPLLKNYLDPKSGQEALIPALGIGNFSALKSYYAALTSSNPVVQETPTVTLLNASDVSGLASREMMILMNQGFKVETLADASADYASTLIVDNTNGQKPAALTALQQDIKGPVVTSSSGSSEAEQTTNYSTDFVVVMGKDWDGTTAQGNPVQN